MKKPEIVVKKVWRSEYHLLITCAISSVACVVLTNLMPWSIITGKLFGSGESTVYLSLPLFWLVPFGAFSLALYRRHNVRYSLNENGVEAIHGRLSLNQEISQVRFDDIRSLEIDQTVIERFLDVGTLRVGTAGTSGVEVSLEGIAAPKEVRDLVQGERDRRQMSHVSQKSSFQSNEVRFGTGGL